MTFGAGVWDMYQCGEFVVYGIQGVCRILGTEKQLVDRKRREFLVLEPVAQAGSKFYVPLENPTAIGKLKPVLTKEALSELLNSSARQTDCWIKEENLRKQTYRELLTNADRAGLLQMVATVIRHREIQAQSGRKFHQCDESFLHDAFKLLCSEIALVMEIPMDRAQDYLRNQLK